MSDNYATLVSMRNELSVAWHDCIEKMQANPELLRMREPMGEVHHTFSNLPNIDSTKLFLEHIDFLNAKQGSATTREIESRKAMVYTNVLRILKQFAETYEISAFRMDAWERQIDFDAIGWEGKKPTEVAREMGTKIETFFAQHPNLETELTGTDGKGGLSMTSPSEFYRQLGTEVGELDEKFGFLRGQRGTAGGEVYHSFLNTILLLDSPVESDDVALRRMKQFAGSYEMSCAPRMKAWEDQLDFDALSLDEKPSEALAEIAKRIETFISSVPHATRGGKEQERG